MRAHKRGKRSSVKKTTAVLKRASTEKNDRWKSRELVSLHEKRWQQPTGSSGGQSAVDTWEHVKPESKWIEVSADYRVLDALVKEKKITWTKSGRESAQREADLYDVLEKAATDEKREERDRDQLSEKEEEDEATCLMEEMRENVESAQHKSYEAERSLCNALREYVDSYDRDQGRARTLMTKCWQSMKSRDTNNLNLEKDLEDIQSTARRVGWCEEEKTATLWKQLEGDEQ